MKGRARHAVWLAAAMLLLGSGAQADSALWTYHSDKDIHWQQITDMGTVLVGTDEALSCLDPDTGKTVWSRNDIKKLNEFQVVAVEGMPILMVSTNEGKSGNTMYALAMPTGKNLWTTERLKGTEVGMLAIPDKNMVLLLTVKNAGTDKDAPDMIALRLTDGEVLWETKFPEKVHLHGIEGKSATKYDLSGHQPPYVDGDAIYFTYAGLHRYDANTGKLVWAVPYEVTEGRIKRGNAQILIAGDTIYTSAKGILRAIEKDSGKIRWTSKDFGGAIAQTALSNGVLYGRMGGHFYDYHEKDKDKRWKLEKPLGVVAVDAKTGTEISHFDKCNESITNMVLLDDTKTILIADLKDLIGLNTGGDGHLSEAYRVPLAFKNKIGGGAQAARMGMRFARGGLIKMATEHSHDEDPPIAISMRENGTAVLRGKQHVLAFDAQSKQIPWSVEYAAPGVPGWENAVMLAITAASYGAAMSGAAHTQFGSSENSMFNDMHRDIADAYNSFAFKRYSATKGGAKHAFVLTMVEEGKEKGAGIIAVDMDSGQPTGQVLFKDREPDYDVDEVTGHVYNIKGKDLFAYALK